MDQIHALTRTTLNVWLGTKPTNVGFGTIKVSCIDWAGKMDFGGNEYIGIRWACLAADPSLPRMKLRGQHYKCVPHTLSKSLPKVVGAPTRLLTQSALLHHVMAGPH